MMKEVQQKQQKVRSGLIHMKGYAVDRMCWILELQAGLQAEELRGN
jgi:hypothetical protein